MGKVIGIVLIIAAGVLAAKIIINRGPILPHIVGPTILAIIGVILLIL
jgi:hypothetical protein